MARNPDKAFVEAFDDDVKMEYQGAEVLDGIAYEKNNIGAESCQFQTFNSVTMDEHSRGSKFDPKNISHGKAKATLSDKRVADISDIFDQDKMDVNERQLLAETFGKAMGREQDQTLYNAIDAGSYSGSQEISASGTDPAGPNAAMNITKLRHAKYHFEDIEVEDNENLYCIWSPESKRQLLATTEVASQDYNQVKALVQGDVNNFLGFEFRRLSSSRDEGGLAVETGTHQNYAVHGRSLGVATGLGPRTDVDWSPEYASWIVQAFLSLGATIIDPEGQVNIKTDGSAAINQS